MNRASSLHGSLEITIIRLIFTGLGCNLQNIAGNRLKREVGGETNIFNLLKFSLEVMKWNRMEFAGMLDGVGYS